MRFADMIEPLLKGHRVRVDYWKEGVAIQFAKHPGFDGTILVISEAPGSPNQMPFVVLPTHLRNNDWEVA